ncbi:MAG: adenosine deaminase [bacterium]
MKIDRETIFSLPKLDLHLHLDGAIRTETIRDLAREFAVELPTYEVEELADHVQVQPDCRSLSDFLECFETFYPVLQYPEALERIAYELCEDLAAQGVIYAETRFAPVLLLEEGASKQEHVDAVLSGLERGQREFDVIVKLILCMYRGTDPEDSQEVAELAARDRDRGIVGIDFAGDESQFDAAPHSEAFALARENDLPLTIHAGEAGAVDNIQEAVDLGAERIGHGVRLQDDPELVEEIIEKQIPLEMCLTSNLQTQAVKTISEHPFPDYYDRGVKVTINTDDPRVSNTDINKEFLLAAREFDLDLDDLQEITRNAVDVAFIGEDVKSELRTKINSAV